MAVEIPVVVDIMGGIDDSIKQLPKAIKKLQTEVDSYPVEAKIRINVEGVEETNDELKQLKEYFQEMEDADWEKIGKDLDFTPYINQSIMELRSLEKQLQEIQDLRQMEGGGTDFAKELADAHKNIREQAAAVARAIAAMEEMQKSFKASGTGINDFINSQYNEVEKRRAQWKALYAELEDYSEKYASSINAIRNRVSELEQTWANMTKTERNASRDEMVNKYKKGVSELKNEAKTLREILQEQERLANLVKQTSQNRRYENAVLKMNGDSIRILSEQQRILTERLNKAKFGTDEFGKYKQQLEEVRQKLQQMQGGVNNVTGAMQKQQGVLGKLAASFAAYVSVHSLLHFAKGIRDITGELEYQRVSLGRLLQDVDRGNYLFERTKQAAVESPFRIKDLVTYTKQLAAYRIEQESLFDTTKRLADISAGLGVDMNRLILAYGQVRAASVLRGQELRQFTEAGIPLVELLAEKFTDLKGEIVSTGDVFELISKRAVPFSMISDIFVDMTEKGGMFYNMQIEQAKTLQGRWEKLKDAYDIALQSIGDTKTFQKENDFILGVLNKLLQHIRLIPKTMEGVAVSWTAFTVLTRVFGNTVRTVTAEEVKLAAAQLATNMGAQEGTRKHARLTAALIAERTATNALSRAMAKLRIAMITNPAIAAAAAIAGLIVAFTTFRKVTDESAEAIGNLNKAVDDMHAANERHDRMDKLIKQYETLATKTERNSAENQTLARTMKKLSNEFPGLKEKIDDQNLSLEDRLRLIQDINAEEAKRINEEKRDKEMKLRAAETRLGTAQEEEDAAKQAERDATAYYNELASQVEKLKKDGKTKRSLLAQVIFGGTEDDIVFNAFERQGDILAKAEEAERKATDNVTSISDGVRDLRRELYGETTEVEETTKAWKDKITEIQREKVAAGAVELFSDKDILSFESVLKFSEKLKDKQDEYTQSLKTNQELLKSATDLTRERIQQDITSDEETIKMIQAMATALGIIFKSSRGGGRDNRLSNLKKDISEITNAYKKFLDLRKYMSENQALSQIGVLFPQLGGWKPTFDSTIARLQEMRDDVAKKLARSPKDKTLLEMQRTLDTEISNLKFDDLKKKIDDELKRISSDIKRSETARNFYNDILGLTGDNELAASLTMSVYGTEGEEFADRIKKQLADSLKKVDEHTFDGLHYAIVNAFNTGDYKYLMEHLEEVPEALRDTVKQVASDSEKYNADWLKNFYQTYQKAKTYEERISTLQSQRDTKVAEAQKRGMSQEGIDAIIAYYAKEISGVELEALKDTYTWTKAFEDLEGVSTQTLKNLIALIDEYIQKNRKSLTPAQLRELTRSKENAEAQVRSRNAYLAVGDALKKLNKASALKNRLEAAGKNGTEEYATALDEEQKAILNLQQALNEIKGHFDEAASAAKDLVSVFASDEYAAYFSEQMDNASKTLGGLGKAATGIASIVMGNITPKTIMQTITGLAEAIAGIFGARNAARMRKANQDIEEQDRLLEDLEYQYGRLQVAMEKSFGSDYIANYNQQLDNLAAKQAAYLKQAEAERSKGKKADEEKIKGYENSARDAADQIRDMQTQLAEFFSGTDLTSAAKDFANAWIEAYKEFGSVTDAMSEKFNDMIQEMVENSVAAQVMQQLLKPIFDEIDRRAREGGELSTEDIAAISKMATEQIPAINDAMTTLMNSLQAAGYDFRQQPGQFTGISRNIANATEESITGLAAGINTQNFYMSMINQNVAAILAVISGGAVPTEGAPSVQFNNELALQRLSGIDDKLATLLNQLDKVIKPMSAPAQYYVSVRQ